MTTHDAGQVRQVVRERYARSAAEEKGCCAPSCCGDSDFARTEDISKKIGYTEEELGGVPEEANLGLGCGNPTAIASLRPGETVLDLGSGAGIDCFLAAQRVGPTGRVIGVDMTPEMVERARRNAAGGGYDNVDFRLGEIEALPVSDESVDVVISNCVLNLVAPADKPRLFRELHRVLRRGGRAVISDIVADEPVPAELQADPELWSGCIAGAMTEQGFLAAFEEAGFYGIRLLARQGAPWRTVEGIEFRSLTVEAFKGKEGPCLERLQAVIYKGPFREVLDDDGHRLRRGERVAVCDKTFRLYGREPYASHVELVEPRLEVPREEARHFDCARTAARHPRETKGLGYDVTTEASGPCCGPEGCC